jgi:Planctomycete extracellular
MLHRLFAGLLQKRTATASARRPQRCRLVVEQLEDRRLLTALPSALGTQTQALTNPTVDGTGATLQYLVAGAFQTVASQVVNVTSNQNGLFQLSFQAQAYSGQSNRLGVRYLIDSQYDPNDAVIRAGTGADVIEDIGTTGWQTLYLTRLLTLTPGTHTIAVQVFTLTPAATTADATAVYSPSLSVVGFSTIDSQSAADGLQVETPASPANGRSGQQDITSGSWQTVSSQSVTVGPTKTGLYDLTFQAQAFAQLSTRISVRYLIDGNLDPRDVADSSNGNGADVTEDITNGFGGGDWHTLFLTHPVVLTGGTHTVTMQVMETPLTVSDSGATLYAPTLSLIGYNTIDGQHSADGLQSQTLANPDAGSPGQQDVTEGSWQTVANLSVPVAGIRSGLYSFSFQASGLTSYSNRVYLRYLIDGNPDPNDATPATSASQADATVDFFNGFGAGTWHTLALTGLVSLAAGTHTISVQVWCTMEGVNNQPDLVVSTPTLRVTGFNNLTPGSTGTGGTTTPPPSTATFSYNPTTQVLVVNGKATNDLFRMTQSSKLVTPPSTTGGGTPTPMLVTTYTFSVNGSSVSYTSNQLSQVQIYGNGGNDSAYIYTNDTYTGSDGKTHATPELLSLGAGGGILQKFDASGNPVNFMQLFHVANIYGYMGNEDSAQLHGGPGNDMFVSAGLASYMTGIGYYDYVTGATSVTAYAGAGHDTAYQYDGSGASVFTATGITSSVMTGTDKGVTFTNTALGFHFNYGIARHAGDTANLYDSPGSDVFIGQKTLSWMYSYTGSVETMHNQVSGFTSVNAFSTAGGIDYSFNYAPTVNSVTGFKHVVG